MSRLASRIVEALRASGAESEAMYHAEMLRNLISIGSKGRLLIPADQGTSTTESDGRSYSRSQMDKASRIENFESLVMFAASLALYKPDETALSINALQSLIAEMRNLNRSVVNAYMDKKNAERSLNRVLYHAGGVAESAALVKGYLRSVFGKRSAEDKEVSQLKFIRR